MTDNTKFLVELSGVKPGETPAQKKTGDPSGQTKNIELVRGVLDRNGIEYTREEVKEGDHYFKLAHCYFNPDHDNTDIIVFQSGAIKYKCFHTSCAGHTWQEFRSQFEKAPVRSSAAQDFAEMTKALTDLGNARRFVEHNSDSARYCSQIGWLIYNGRCWQRDETNKVMLLAEETTRRIYEEASQASAESERKAIASHALRTESLQKRRTMVEGAAPHLAVRVDDLDSDPWLLNVINGTIDLRTFKFRPHDPADLITKLAPVNYDPTATRPRFEQFLAEIFPDEMGLGIGNTDLIRFVQKAAGSWLTGDTRDQVFIVAHGGGSNGKSTLFSALQNVLGDYSSATPAETLLSKKGDGGATNDLARLRGARVVIASETPEGRRLNAALVKQLTGQDRIAARFLHKEFFEFTPAFKLVLLTNYKPSANSDDYALWRRMRLVPFTEKFEGAARDNTLNDTLRKEASGILNWALEGCRLWQHEGLEPPMDVKAATETYRIDNDLIADWLEERCVEGGSTTSTDAYSDFSNWLRTAAPRATFSHKRFTQGLIQKGYTADKGAKGARSIVGFKLRREF